MFDSLNVTFLTLYFLLLQSGHCCCSKDTDTGHINETFPVKLFHIELFSSKGKYCTIFPLSVKGFTADCCLPEIIQKVVCECINAND